MKTLRAKGEEARHDLRFAARSLGRTPAFTVTTVATLMLGLALVATTLAVVNAYLIRAMPFPAAERLHHVNYAEPGGGQEPRGVTGMDWTPLNDVLDMADGSNPARFTLRDTGDMREAGGLRVARGSLEALGVRAVQGRSFAEEDYRVGAEQVAMIAHELWRDYFGADPKIVGRIFRASGSGRPEDPIEAYRIVGVLPPEFRFARDYARGIAEVVVPLREPSRAYFVRLRAGVPVAFAEQRITEAVRRLGKEVPPDWRGVRLESVRERYVAGLRPVVTAVAVAAGLVLLIVTANLAVLTLLRAMRRQKEMAVRVALGAERRHLVRLLVAETFLLCGAALAGALVLTAWALRAVAPIIEARLGKPVPGGAAALSLDPTVLLLVGGAGVAIALSLSFLPMLTLWHRGLADGLRREGRSGTDRPATRRLRSALIVVEVAASLALLVGGGLMIRSVWNLVNADLGYVTDGVLRARVGLVGRSYTDAASYMRFHDRLAERLAAMPGVSFAVSSFIPFNPTPRQPVEIEPGQRLEYPVGVIAVNEGYFSTLRIPLKQGRAFAASDRAGAEAVAIVSETLARRLWPEGSALGRRIRTADQPVPNSPMTTEWRTIVGVARDVRQTHADTDLNDIYVPFAQAPSRYSPLFLRSDRPVTFWAETLRVAVAELDPNITITGLVPLTEEGDRLLAGPRFLMAVLAGFAGFAALLAVLGIYGVTAYAVQQREREVAIRMALGATGGAVVRMFVAGGGRLFAGGVVLGLGAAVGVGRVLANQIHGVTVFDGATVAASAGFIAGAGLLATWWPARRAAAAEPMRVLKEE